MTRFSASLDGVAVETPLIDGRDRGFQLGDGVFDTMTAFGGVPFLWTRHLERLSAAAAAIGLAFDGERVDKIVRDVCARLDGADAVVRTTLSRGVAERGLWPTVSPAPTLLVTTQPWSAALAGAPARLVTASVPRNERSPLSRLKTLSCLDNVLAMREAVRAGGDDALILNCQGQVASSSMANVFLLVGDRLITPPLADGALAGTIRALLLESAAELGLKACEESLTPASLNGGDAVFLTNSVRLVRPVTSLDGTALSQSSVTDQILQHILASIVDACGRNLHSLIDQGGR